MNVAVIGSNGFIGRHLVSRLALLNNVKVFAFDIADYTPFGDNVVYKKNDLSDGNRIKEDFAQIDLVYFLASATIPATSWDKPLKDIEQNLIPFIRFVEIVASLKLKRIAFLSSAGTIYGTAKQKVRENSEKNPFSPYGITKLTMEHFLLYFKTRYNIDYDIYRISNVYGEGQNTSAGLGLINTLLEKIISEKRITIFGDGENLRNYIYVKDVVELLSYSTKPGNHEPSVYNVSSDDTLTINQIVAIIKTIVMEDFEIFHHTNRLSDNAAIDLDNSKLKKDFPDFRFTSLTEGISKTYNYIKNNSQKRV
jgi:UDP-glucose 4-epimerase